MLIKTCFYLERPPMFVRQTWSGDEASLEVIKPAVLIILGAVRDVGEGPWP